MRQLPSSSASYPEATTTNIKHSPANYAGHHAGLLAGAVVASEASEEDTTDEDVHENLISADDDEAVVRVGDELLNLLRREVTTTAQCIAQREYQGEHRDFP